MASFKISFNFRLLGAVVFLIACMCNISSPSPTSPSPTSASPCDGITRPKCREPTCCEKDIISQTNSTTNQSQLLDTFSGLIALNKYMQNFYVKKLFFNPFLEKENPGKNVYTLHEKALKALAVLQQYLYMFNIINADGENVHITYFQVMVKQLLKDTCNWLNSHPGSSITNCDDPTEFALILMALHTRSLISGGSGDLACYLSYYNLEDLNERAWTENVARQHNETQSDDFVNFIFPPQNIM